MLGHALCHTLLMRSWEICTCIDCPLCYSTVCWTCVCFVCVGVDFYSRMIRLEDKTISLQLWDTAGQERCVTTLWSWHFRYDTWVCLLSVYLFVSSFSLTPSLSPSFPCPVCSACILHVQYEFFLSLWVCTCICAWGCWWEVGRGMGLFSLSILSQ